MKVFKMRMLFQVGTKEQLLSEKCVWFPLRLDVDTVGPVSS